MKKDDFGALLACLPPHLRRELDAMRRAHASFDEDVFELHLRVGRLSSLTRRGKNIPLITRLSQEDMEAMLAHFCRHSVYAYGDTLAEGYIRISGGYRVGVAGRAVTEGGRVVGVRDVSGFCIRVAHSVTGAGDVAVRTFRRLDCQRGILVYAPPGVGKTTMLRDAADTLSRGAEALRVAVVDCRGELCGTETLWGMVDALEGYTKAKGIEIATRTLAPQVIVCDEIGGYDEAESILAVQSSGVPLIASAHGDCLASLLARPAVGVLDKAGIFGAYIGIKYEGGAYTYTVDMKEEVS